MFFPTASSVTCLLNAGPFCFVKSAQEVSCHWIHEVIPAYLREVVVLTALKQTVVHILLKRPSMNLATLKNFHPFPCWEGFSESSWALAPEDPKGDRLSILISVGFQTGLQYGDSIGSPY